MGRVPWLMEVELLSPDLGLNPSKQPQNNRFSDSGDNFTGTKFDGVPVSWKEHEGGC
jgi:hypothetical protein